MVLPVRGALVAEVAGQLDSRAGPTTVIVDGPPGIGKSTLLAAVAGQLSESGSGRLPAGATDIRWASGTETSVRMPYGMVGDALQVPVPLPPPPDITDRLVARIDELAAVRPQLLVFDDTHHADSDSLAMIWRLGMMAADLPIAVLLARRRYPVRELLTLLAGQPAVRSVSLEPLTGTELAALAADLVDGVPAPELLRVLAAAGGNPLQIRDLVARMAGRGDLLRTPGADAASGDLVFFRGPQGARWADMDPVSATMADQLGQLTPRAAEVCRLLAVWGRPGGPADLARVQGSTVLALAPAISEAVGDGVLAWASADLLGFGHDVYRDAAYEAIDPPLRRVMHRACADYLRARHEPSGVVGYHLERAADPAQPTVTAGELAVVAAGSSAGVAADLLATVAGMPIDDPEMADRIALDRVQLLLKAGRMAEAGRVAEAALATVRSARTAGTLVRMLLLTYSTRARVDDVDRIVARALASPALPPTTRTRLQVVREWVHVLAGDTGAAVEGGAPVGDTVSPELGTLPVATSAVRAMLSGDGLAAVRLAEVAAEGYHRLAGYDSSETSSVDLWPPLFRSFTFGTYDAANYLEHWRARSARRQDAWVDPFHQFSSASLAMNAGRLDDARAEFDAGFESVAESSTGWTSWAVGDRCLLDLDGGAPDRARLRATEFRSLSLPDTLGLPIFDLVDAQIAFFAGDLSGALSCITAAWAHAAAAGNRLWFVAAGVDSVAIVVAAGETGLATGMLGDLRSIDITHFPAAEPVVALAAAIAAGDRTGAAAEAADRLHSLGNVRDAALGRAFAAEAAARAGADQAARKLGRAALDSFDAMGAIGRSRLLTARLRAHGISMGVSGARRRPATGWESLTRTELSIAELIGAGQSGPEIARALFISPRTVQTHVSHALHKLGLGTRLELAAAVAAHAGS